MFEAYRFGMQFRVASYDCWDCTETRIEDFSASGARSMKF